VKDRSAAGGGGSERREAEGAEVAGFAVVRRRSSWLRYGVTVSWRRRVPLAARSCVCVLCVCVCVCVCVITV